MAQQVFKDAVCKIEILNANNEVITQGAGFHYSGGWVISNANNFQTVSDEDNRYSNLQKARYSFHVNGDLRVFDVHKRVALVHHLQLSSNPALRDNIAMVKLGVQYVSSRQKTDWEQWEVDEEILLDGIPSTDENQQLPALQPEMSAKAFYPCPGTEQIMDINWIIKVVRGNVISLRGADENAARPLPPGSLGCIISVEQPLEIPLLVAIHFGGDRRLSHALRVTEAAQKFILGGARIKDHVDDYVSYFKVDRKDWAIKEKEELENLAKEHSITIYIPLIKVPDHPETVTIIN